MHTPDNKYRSRQGPMSTHTGPGATDPRWGYARKTESQRTAKPRQASRPITACCTATGSATPDLLEIPETSTLSERDNAVAFRTAPFQLGRTMRPDNVRGDPAGLSGGQLAPRNRAGEPTGELLEVIPAPHGPTPAVPYLGLRRLLEEAGAIRTTADRRPTRRGRARRGARWRVRTRSRAWARSGAGGRLPACGRDPNTADGTPGASDGDGRPPRRSGRMPPRLTPLSTPPGSAAERP